MHDQLNDVDIRKMEMTGLELIQNEENSELRKFTEYKVKIVDQLFLS